MKIMDGLKVLGGLGVLLSVLGVIHTISGWAHDAAVLKTCRLAVADPHGPADVGGACPPAITADHLVARQASACDAALAASSESAAGVEASCTLPVRRVVVERDVARGEARRLTDALNQERLGQDAAIARASASATTLAERKVRAAVAVQAAPRDGDGLVVCDAQCMRSRWGVAGEQQ